MDGRRDERRHGCDGAPSLRHRGAPEALFLRAERHVQRERVPQRALPAERRAARRIRGGLQPAMQLDAPRLAAQP